uniref:Uncharacterized protein n=1 Tax=Chelydra serpentina TaxID=8475 RepID=A0A8C3T0A5_CHESE
TQMMPGPGAWYLVEGPIGAPHLHHQLLHVVPRRLGAGCPGPAPPRSLSGGGEPRFAPGVPPPLRPRSERPPRHPMAARRRRGRRPMGTPVGEAL